MVNNIPLLTAGGSGISLYADASYSSELQMGCWAFSIPAFPLDGTGIEGSGSINHLELAAVVHGLCAVTALDFANRAVHIYTIRVCDAYSAVRQYRIYATAARIVRSSCRPLCLPAHL